MPDRDPLLAAADRLDERANDPTEVAAPWYGDERGAAAVWLRVVAAFHWRGYGQRYERVCGNCVKFNDEITQPLEVEWPCPDYDAASRFAAEVLNG